MLDQIIDKLIYATEIMLLNLKDHKSIQILRIFTFKHRKRIIKAYIIKL